MTHDQPTQVPVGDQVAAAPDESDQAGERVERKDRAPTESAPDIAELARRLRRRLARGDERAVDRPH